MPYFRVRKSYFWSLKRPPPSLKSESAYIHVHTRGLAIILRRLSHWFGNRCFKNPRAFRFKDLLGFLLCILLVLGRFTVRFGLWDDRLFDSSCCAVSQLYSSRGVAKSPALAYSLVSSHSYICIYIYWLLWCSNDIHNKYLLHLVLNAPFIYSPDCDSSKRWFQVFHPSWAVVIEAYCA